MTRVPGTTSDLAMNDTPTSGPLAPSETPETGLVGGTFRLDSMSPGSAAAAGGFAAPKKPNVLVQLGFFAVLLAAAGGVVYSMRKMGIGPLKAFATTQVPDYDVTKTPGGGADHTKVLNELTRASTNAQVPADQVQKNPFRLADALGAGAEETDDAKKSEAQRIAAETRARKEAEARARGIEARLNNLRIHSIMSGTTPVARVNSDFVRVGDVIEETFSVKAINERSIEIEADGVTYLLSLDDQPAKKGAPARRK